MFQSMRPMSRNAYSAVTVLVLAVVAGAMVLLTAGGNQTAIDGAQLAAPQGATAGGELASVSADDESVESSDGSAGNKVLVTDGVESGDNQLLMAGSEAGATGTGTGTHGDDDTNLAMQIETSVSSTTSSTNPEAVVTAKDSSVEDSTSSGGPASESKDKTTPSSRTSSPTTQATSTSPTNKKKTTTTTAAARKTTSTSAKATTTTIRATTTTTRPPAPSGGQRFATLAPGASLPSGEWCAARVKPRPETRSMNAGYNATRGSSSHDLTPRVDGNFVGTTDEIIQWAACKWGIDEDVARAQTAIESWWDMRNAGDRNNDQNACHPQLRTSSGPCPESIGLMQVRYLYHTEAFEDSNAIRSSAYNLDYAYSVWRACYNGELTWLNDVERGRNYAAGDLEGCLGVWFSGRWYTADAVTYIGRVNDYLARRVWEQSDFLGYTG